MNCEWGEWSAYTGCTKTCGGGTQYRYRTILTLGENGGTTCVGTDNVEDQACNTQTCSGSYATNTTALNVNSLVNFVHFYRSSNFRALTIHNILKSIYLMDYTMDYYDYHKIFNIHLIRTVLISISKLCMGRMECLYWMY